MENLSSDADERLSAQGQLRIIRNMYPKKFGGRQLLFSTSQIEDKTKLRQKDYLKSRLLEEIDHSR